MTDLARYPSLVDKAVLVTGGASGIGAALVEGFARQGARVGFVDLAAAEGEALAAALAADGVRHAPAFAPADLTDTGALREAIAGLRSRCGPFTALVNNAANDRRESIDDTTPAGFDAGVAVNLKHQLFAAQAVVPDMRAAGGGSIVNLGSITWMIKQANLPVYAACKAAVQGLTRSMARELGPARIRVNTVAPGWVITEKQRRLWWTPTSRDDIARGQCLPDLLMPGHVASMVLFLAADDSAMCTAQDFIVDGGWA